MAEFPQDLNEGSFWPHSDVFMTEPPSRRQFSSYMDDLFHQLSALTLLKQSHRNLSKPPTKTSFSPQRFGQAPVPPVPCGEENPSCVCQGCSSLNNNNNNNRFKVVPRPVYNGNNNIGNSELFYKHHMRKPVQSNQVDVFHENRGRFLLRQHHHNQQLKLHQNRALQNRFDGGFGAGGFVKVTGGTGVFHPRVCSTNSNITPLPTDPAFVKTTQVNTQNKSELLIPPQLNYASTKSFGHSAIAPEMSLPKDWTY